MSLLQKHEELRGILEMIVYAKQHGMLDHPTAKDLLAKALAEVGVVVAPSGFRQGH